MELIRALALSLALLGGAVAAQADDTGNWRFHLRLDPAAEAAPAFAKLLREMAASRLEAFTREMLAAPPPPLSLIDITDHAVFASPEFISLHREMTEDRGGAHTQTRVTAWTWDVSENRLAALSDFVQGQVAMEQIAAALRKAALAAHDGAPAAFWRAEIERALTSERLSALPFTLAPSSEPGKAAALDFHVSPYVLAPYSRGPLSLRVDLSVLDPLLTERARRLFGGDVEG